MGCATTELTGIAVTEETTAAMTSKIKFFLNCMFVRARRLRGVFKSSWSCEAGESWSSTILFYTSVESPRDFLTNPCTIFEQGALRLKVLGVGATSSWH